MLRCIGLKIVAIKAFSTNRRKKTDLEPSYILFEDGKTYIELDDQDYFAYHDCNSTAKTITTRQDERMWKMIMENQDGNYPDADSCVF